jgi:hypothetical protein
MKDLKALNEKIFSKFLHQMTNVKKLTDFSSESIGEKSKALEEAANVTTYLAYFGIGIGGFSLMQVAIMISFLFRIVKKFIFVNTAYPMNMKHLIYLMNPFNEAIQKKVNQPHWYNYRNSNTNMVLSPGVFHVYSIWSLKVMYIKILLILIFRRLRVRLYRNFEVWRRLYGIQYFKVEKKDSKDKDKQKENSEM